MSLQQITGFKMWKHINNSIQGVPKWDTDSLSIISCLKSISSDKQIFLLLKHEIWKYSK